MANIPSKISDRFVKQVGKYQKILKKASDNDINEADTVTIIVDILSDIFGYDKYTEITSEYAIRNTYCDLAIKLDDEVKYLIEVKSISLDLKENHLWQAIDYGAHEGIQWVILTNGLIWQCYNISLKETIEYEKIFELDFLTINPRKIKDQELLYLLAKEGINKDVISEYKEHVQSLNRYVLAALILSEPVLDSLRKEIRKLTPGIKVDNSEIETILKNEVIKRNVIDCDGYSESEKRIKRHLNKVAKSKQKSN